LNKTNLSQDELNRALMDILSVPDRDIFKVLLLVAQVGREGEGKQEGEREGEEVER
jgi:hypothetical protein